MGYHSGPIGVTGTAASILDLSLSHFTMLLARALINGLWLSLALTCLMLVSGAIALDMWVDDYPPDIKQKYGPMSSRAARARPFVAVAVFLTAVLIPVAGLFSLPAEAGAASPLAAWLFAATGLLFFNVFDLLILDWLFFCTIQPRAMVLPGTEGMAGYRDYRFHFTGFLKGLVFCAFGGLVVSAVWMLLQALPWTA